MINKIIIGAENQNVFDFLKKTFTNNIFDIIRRKENIFYLNSDFDVAHYYGFIAEKFNRTPLYLEASIINTERKYDLPPFIVTSPSFKSHDEFVYLEMMLKQSLIPLEKAINFSLDKSEVKTYGVHTNLLFSKPEDIIKYGYTLYDNILKLLMKYNLVK